MTRNLVLCFDGTGAQLRARANSNVVLTFQALDLTDPARQVGYYDPGVGTRASASAWSPPARALSRLIGLALGGGTRANLGDAYTWLMREWSPGDQIYLFGFSRGAYTARALAGLLYAIGIPRPGSENVIPYLIATYARPIGEKHFDFDELGQASRTFALPTANGTKVPVHYMGLWDTVKSVGLLRWQTQWPWTNRLPLVGHIRHAVSIDEHRAPFAQDPVDETTLGQLEETWFAGAHSDVGGTFEDDPSLSRITLSWILQDAARAGLLLMPARTPSLPVASDANGKIHQVGPLWALLGIRRRAIPANAAVHASVQERIKSEPSYRTRLRGPIRFVDEAWDQQGMETPAP